MSVQELGIHPPGVDKPQTPPSQEDPAFVSALAAMAETVTGGFRDPDAGWRVPPSNKSPGETGAAFTTTDGVVWKAHTMDLGLSGEGVYGQVDKTDPGGTTHIDFMSSTEPSRRFVAVTTRRSGKPPVALSSMTSPSALPAAQAVIGEFGELNGDVIRVENILTGTSARVVFQRPPHT